MKKENADFVALPTFLVCDRRTLCESWIHGDYLILIFSVTSCSVAQYRGTLGGAKIAATRYATTEFMHPIGAAIFNNSRYGGLVAFRLFESDFAAPSFKCWGSRWYIRQAGAPDVHNKTEEAIDQGRRGLPYASPLKDIAAICAASKPIPKQGSGTVEQRIFPTFRDLVFWLRGISFAYPDGKGIELNDVKDYDYE